MYSIIKEFTKEIELNLLEVNLSELSEKERMQLAVFHRAYQPHGSIPDKKMLKKEAKPYFSDVKCIDEIKAQAKFMDTFYYRFLESVTRDSDGNICDDEV